MIPFGIGFSELIVIMLVLLLVVGPDKLPDLARLFGKGLRTARKASDELRDALAIDELKREIYRPVDNWKTPLPPEREGQALDAHDGDYDDHDYHDEHHDGDDEHSHDEHDPRDDALQSEHIDDEDEEDRPFVQATSDPLLDGLVITPQPSRRESLDPQAKRSSASVNQPAPESEREGPGDA